MVAPTLLWLVKLCHIGLAIVVPGSSGKEGMLDRVQEKSTAYRSPLEPNGLAFSLAPGMLPVASAPVAKTTEGPVSSSSPVTSVELPPHTMARPPFVAPIASLPAPPPLHFQVPIPSVLPSSPQVVAVDSSPVASPGPVASPPRHSPETSPSVDQSPDRISSHSSPQNPPADTQWKKNATPPTSAPQSSPAIHSRRHSAIPVHINKSNMSRYKAPISAPILPDPAASPISAPLKPKTDGVPVVSPSNQTPKALPPSNHSPRKGFVTAEAPTHKAVRQSNNPPGPHFLPPDSPPSLGYYAPAVSPSNSFHKHQGLRNKFNSPHAPAYLASPPSKQQGPISSPSVFPGKKQKHFAPPTNPVLPSKYPGRPQISPAPSPSLATTTSPAETPVISQKVSPSGILSRTPKVPLRPPVQAFPPPPPNEDCAAIICTEPLTNRLPGSPCGCVQPMQVGLCLNVALYTFFPSVPELASEISAGVFMKQSQVRVIGANAASEQPEKTIVLIDLVPIGDRFDTMTAFLTFQRFWHKQVIIKASLFGDYEVLYVNYPGLPPSPPSPPSSIGILDDGPYPANDNNAGLKPLGVAVRKKLPKNALGRGMIAVIVLSTSAALVLCSAVAWIFLFKHRDCSTQLSSKPHSLQQSLAKASGSGGSMIGSGLTSASLSYGSSIVTYSGSAKTFSASEIERATNNFDASKILGEGGFGRVYSGVLEDGSQVAVKVLKRDDQQGSREFLAEVEMLSRLHHRNLVKLMGICTEERIRCLVYELIPNGSVESHLHGVDKKLAALDWDARMKIALGAARGLAYLHEDSSPCVIHRDFKASNILLEHDFMPKVSDFGLARTAMDGTRHISTRVMGTFGYVAPEYAMTGHLLVKSDVYSYGVVLLELLTGRKPVDMSQPPGQENLVSWARPLLTNREGVESIIDPTLGPTAPFDSVVKVAAIASMCVQPEVSNRPFMGEVVQALKLVCNECDETKEVDSRSLTADDDSSIDMAADVSMSSRQLTHPPESHYSVPSYDSDPETERGLSVSEVYSGSAPGRYGHPFGSLRRHSTSSPLRTARSRQLWQKMRRFSHGAVRDHGVMFRFWPASR